MNRLTIDDYYKLRYDTKKLLLLNWADATSKDKGFAFKVLDREFTAEENNAIVQKVLAWYNKEKSIEQ